VFFLHLGRESKPRWNLNALLFAVLVVVIIVFGSLWIMHNLNYHMQNPQQINKYLRSQGDL
jgi:cytochrome o ubiquinol oxidase operon protein cyoD